ncbi:hypothetical protein F5Y18DRAFT_438852 [Xylariaceae sp. FL1019]|nr:hypothetical protein F5Y18DRAFT_438852 [Xylariaceae sp. FL1019]
MTDSSVGYLGLVIYSGCSQIRRHLGNEYTEHSSVKKIKTINPIRLPFTQTFNNHAVLIDYLKQAFRVTHPWSSISTCSIIGPVTQGDHPRVTELALSESQPVRILDIKKAMKESFNINLFCYQVANQKQTRFPLLVALSFAWVILTRFREKDVYNFLGNRVVKHITQSGHVLAIKVKPLRASGRSRGDMMHHAATHGVLASRVRCIYDMVALNLCLAPPAAELPVRDGKTTSIVDWEASGFFPQYAEYAFAKILCRQHEIWWLPVLDKVLQPCLAKRLEFTKLIEDRGWWQGVALLHHLFSRLSSDPGDRRQIASHRHGNRFGFPRYRTRAMPDESQ